MQNSAFPVKMSQEASFSNHHSYNNRFLRTSSSGGDSSIPATVVNQPALQTSSTDDVDVFGHSVNFGKLISPKETDVTRPPAQRTSSSQEQSRRCSEVILGIGPNSPAKSGSRSNEHEHVGQMSSQECSSHGCSSSQVVSPPAAPGKPRRMSRQLSAGTKRQNFVVGRSVSGGNSTSVDSTRDDVFVELDGVEAASYGGGHHHQQQQHALYDSCLFPGKRGQILSTSSTTRALPNPYNHINHRLHDAVWFCNCLYFVFFCCLPAIHFMEQSDVHFKLDDQKKASRLGRASTVLFFVGTLLALLFFSMVFFLAIYFTTR